MMELIDELRSYQQSTLLAARKGNTVMVGGTGVGKTWVALQLLRDADCTRGRVAFFLAPTVSLAYQQHRRIDLSLARRTLLCVGEESDSWDISQWQEFLGKSEVVVCTPQILLNLLDKGDDYMSMERISLLVFDECHKAVKKHPYARIMRYYDSSRYKSLPKVFGMTATPTPQCHVTLHSELHVCPVDETQAFAARADLDIVQYTPFTGATDAGDVESVVQAFKAMAVQVADSEWDQVRWTYENHGPWFGLRHIQLVLEHCVATQPASSFLDADGSSRRALVKLFINFLSRLLTRSACSAEAQLCHDDEHESTTTTTAATATPEPLTTSTTTTATTTSTSFITRLITVLNRYDCSEDFRALVFVRRRVMCRLIYERLSLEAQFSGRCGFAVGQSSAASGVADHGLPDVTVAVKAFKSGETRVLVSTDTLAEGIDVPECSLVVSCDELPNRTVYAQMRGRARRRDGRFVVLVTGEEERERTVKLHEEAESFATGQSGLEACSSEDTLLSRLYPQYVHVVVRTGATLSLENSTACLYRFCQYHGEGMDPVLDYVAHAEDGSEGGMNKGAPPQWQCVMELPVALRIEMDLGTFTSPVVPSKSLAKAIAAFLACCELHRLGAIDDHLNPRSPYSSRHPPNMRLQRYRYWCNTLMSQAEMEASRIDVVTRAKEHMGLEPILPPPQQGPEDDGVAHCYLYAFNTHTCVGSQLGVVTRSPLPHTNHHLQLLTCVSLRPEQLDALVLFHVLLVHRVMHGHDMKKATVCDEADLRKRVRAGCDRGYLLTLLHPSAPHIDTDTIARFVSRPAGIHADADAEEEGGARTLWPLPLNEDGHVEPCDWMLEQGSKVYVIMGLSHITLKEGRVRAMQELAADQASKKARQAARARLETEAALHAANVDVTTAVVTRTPSSSFADEGQAVAAVVDDCSTPAHDTFWGDVGGAKLQIRQHAKDVWDSLEASQPLLVAEKVVDTSHMFRHGIGGDNTGKMGERRLLAPQLCRLLNIPARVYHGVQNALAVLFELENDLKVQHLHEDLGIPRLSVKALRKAVTRPDYELLEMLGDAYLKYVISHYVTTVKPLIESENTLSCFRANLVSNMRLLHEAKRRELQGYLILRKAVECMGLLQWAPSLMEPGLGTIKVPGKVVADIVESLLATCLLEGGPVAADQFLTWMGLPVGCGVRCTQPQPNPPPLTAFWPIIHRDCKCWTSEALENYSLVYPIGFPAPAEDMLCMLSGLESILGYTFGNKWLAIQALTHPSSSGKLHRTCTGEMVYTATYERMEFLGDAILDYITVSHLVFEYLSTFQRDGGGDEEEGVLVDRVERAKEAIVSNDALARRAVDWLELHRFMDCDSVDLRMRMQQYADLPSEARAGAGPKALADVVESLVAAVFLDSGGNLQLIKKFYFAKLRNVQGEKDAVGSDVGDEVDVGGDAESGVLKVEDLRRLHRAFPSLMTLACRCFPEAMDEVCDDHEW